MVPGWRPLNDQHAIADMHITVELDKPVTEPEFVRLLNAKSRFSGLDDANVDRGFAMLPFGAQMPVLDVRRRMPAYEVRFDRFKEDATVAERIAASGRSLVYLTSDYTRWAQVSARAAELLDTMSGFVGNPVPVTLTVRYSDIFLGGVVDGQVPHPAGMFRPTSGLVVPAAAASGDYFHSHTGFFRQLPSTHRALINCDIEFSGTDEAKSLFIMTSVKVFVAHDDFRAANTTPRASLHNLADIAHIECKNILHRLMADEVNSRIGLKVQ